MIVTNVQTYQRPTSVEEAWRMLNEGGKSAKLVGGGVDVGSDGNLLSRHAEAPGRSRLGAGSEQDRGAAGHLEVGCLHQEDVQKEFMGPLLR